MNLDQLKWTDARELGVLGQGWTDTDRPYDRFPKHMQAQISEALWVRSRNASGLRLHVTTDSPVLAADWNVINDPIYGDKMGMSVVSGLDLYVRHEGRWHWRAMTWPDTHEPTRKFLFQEMLPGEHEYILYFPPLNDLEYLALGVAPDAKLQPAPALPGKPILFYGTSIVHGGCASRSGMTYPAILGRRFDRNFYNLGFGGQGRMEIEVARLLAELDPAVYVIDPLPNLQPDEVAERAEPFIRTLRDAHPDTPIVLVENVTYADTIFIPERAKRIAGNNAAFRNAYDKLLDEGMTGLTWVPGGDLLGHDDEATVDGVHPTDLGFMRMADVLEPVLKTLI